MVYRHGGGRPEKLTPTQKKHRVEWLDAGPLVVGFETAGWNSVLIRVLIWREFGVLYNRHDVCTLLHHLGFSFQKAWFVSDHLDEAKRQAWLRDKWPAIRRGDVPVWTLPGGKRVGPPAGRIAFQKQT